MKDHGDALSKEEKDKIDSSIKDLQEALKTDNKDEIEAKNKALAEASQKLGEKVYAEQQAKQQAQGAPQGGNEEKTVDADVVDAEFEEVKDEKKESKSDK
jgi:molecular chaperone DnaK